MTLKPEDYLEPNCVLCEKPPGYEPPRTRIPQKRISEKLSEFINRRDFDGARRLLEYWLSEAKAGNDLQGCFMIYNEMMGMHRQAGRREEAYKAVEEGMKLIDVLGYGDTVSGATCYVNAGTVYCAFNEPEKGIALFEKALPIYKEKLGDDKYKLGGLYNNMALTQVSLKRYDEAQESYRQALEVMKTVEGGQLEQAITWLNIADAVIAREGIEKADENELNGYLQKAKEMLDTEELPRDSYYAYVAEKCLGVYEYFGWFRYVRELKERIKQIYERS